MSNWLEDRAKAVAGSTAGTGLIGDAISRYSSGVSDFAGQTLTGDIFENGRAAIDKLDPTVATMRGVNDIAGNLGMDNPYSDTVINNSVDTLNSVGAAIAVWYLAGQAFGGESAASGEAASTTGSSAGSAGATSSSAGSTNMGLIDPITGGATTTGGAAGMTGASASAGAGGTSTWGAIGDAMGSMSTGDKLMLTSAIMQGVGAASAADQRQKELDYQKEQDAYQKEQDARRLTNINAPFTIPAIVKPYSGKKQAKPTGLINTQQPLVNQPAPTIAKVTA